MIIDVFIWSYELEAVNLRLNVLRHCVDAHVAVQATNTFRGTPREVYMLASDFKNVHESVVTIPDGLNAWESEKWLRDEALNQAVKLFGEDATYIVSDGDEIPNPYSIAQFAGNKKPMKLMTDYRNFYADWRAADHVLEHQPTIARYRDYVRAGGACDARWSANWRKSNDWGWHLSSLGDTSEMKLKTFAHEEYDTPETIKMVKRAKNHHRDFLNRFDLEYTTTIPPHTPDRLLGGRI